MQINSKYSTKKRTNIIFRKRNNLFQNNCFKTNLVTKQTFVTKKQLFEKNQNLSLPNDGWHRVPVSVANEGKFFPVSNSIGKTTRLQNLNWWRNWNGRIGSLVNPESDQESNIKLYCLKFYFYHSGNHCNWEGRLYE